MAVDRFRNRKTFNFYRLSSISKFAVISCLSLPIHANSFANENKNPISSITVDSGLLQNSARAFWKFGQDVDGVVSTGFDLLNSSFLGDYTLTRFALSGLFYWQWNRLEYGFFVANHELGHGARFYAVGGKPIYQWEGEAWENDIFSIWIGGFTRYGHGARATSSTQLTSQYYPADFNLLVAAGGMNNSTQYAEFIEDQISFGGGGHILQYPGYVRAKQDASTYVDITNGGQSGDVATVISEYASRGISISPQQMKTGSLISRWGSATHWAILFATLKHGIQGNPTVQSLYVGAIKLPDISHYMTSQGLSYKIRSAYNTGTSLVPLNLEYVYAGTQVAELGVGFRGIKNKSTSRLGWNASVNSKGGFGFRADLSLVPNPSSYAFDIGTSFYTKKSIEGERLLGRYLEGASAGYEVWARLTIDY